MCGARTHVCVGPVADIEQCFSDDKMPAKLAPQPIIPTGPLIVGIDFLWRSRNIVGLLT